MLSPNVAEFGQFMFLKSAQMIGRTIKFSPYAVLIGGSIGMGMRGETAYVTAVTGSKSMSNVEKSVALGTGTNVPIDQ